MSRRSAEADMARDSAETTNRPERRLRWWHVLLTFLALVIAAFVLWHLNLDRAIEAELQTIRDAGYPATPAELDAWYKRIPDEENAALIWLDAFALIRELPDASRQRLVPYLAPRVRVGEMATQPIKPWEPYPPEQIELMREYAALNEPAIEKARQARALKRSRYPNDYSLATDFGVAGNMVYMPRSRMMASTLLIDASLAVEREDGGRAAESARLILALTDSLEQEPMLDSQFHRMAEQERAAYAVERIINHIALAESELRGLSEAIERSLRTPPLRPVLIGRRAMLRTALAVEMSGSSPTDRLSAILWRATGLLQLSELRGLDYYRRMIEAQQLLPHDRQAATERIEHDVKQQVWTEWYYRIHLPSLTGTQAFQLHLRTAQAAVAVERFRVAHGALPDTLDDLIPEFLESVPLDPFTGDPLRYVKSTNGHYKVYSVGEDGVDDGGARKRFGPGSDIIFEVRR